MTRIEVVDKIARWLINIWVGGCVVCVFLIMFYGLTVWTSRALDVSKDAAVAYNLGGIAVLIICAALGSLTRHEWVKRKKL